MVIEDKEYIQMLTPFRNGCKYKLIFKKSGVYIDFGCYLMPGLQTGASRYMYELLSENGNKPIKLNMKPSLKAKLLMIKPCKNCGGALHEIQKN